MLETVRVYVQCEFVASSMVWLLPVAAGGRRGGERPEDAFARCAQPRRHEMLPAEAGRSMYSRRSTPCARAAPECTHTRTRSAANTRLTNGRAALDPARSRACSAAGKVEGGEGKGSCSATPCSMYDTCRCMGMTGREL